MKRYRYLIVLVLCALLAAIFAFTGKGKQRMTDEIVLDKGWTVYVDEKCWQDVTIGDFRFPMTERGAVVTLEYELGDELGTYPVLSFYHAHTDLRVYVGDEEIYSYGQEDYDMGKVVGYGYHFIPLPEDAAGATLRIVMRVSESRAFSTLKTPSIAENVNSMRNFVSERRFELACILFLIVFGILLLCVTIFYALKNRVFYRLVYIGLFSIAVGFWSFCNYDLTVVFAFNPRVKAIAEFGALYLAPCFLFAYFGQEIGRMKNRVWSVGYKLILGLQWTFVIVAYSLQMLNLVHFQRMLTIEHVLMLVMCLFIVAMITVQIKSGQVQNKVMIYGGGMLTFFTLADLARFNLQRYVGVIPNMHFRSMIYLGIFMFVIALLLDFCVQILYALYDTAEHDTLERLAYTDYLTGLGNRRCCEDVFDRMDRAQGHHYTLVSLDLNELKQVNDKLGHEEGDRYLQTFADVLRSSFPKEATIGRMGGDEFIVIMEAADEIAVAAYLSAMNENIRQQNEQEECWHMSVSYGVCYKGESGTASVREANRLADERMYQQKFERKRRKQAGME